MRPFFITENTGGTDQKFGLSVTQQVFDDKMAETTETKLEWAGEKRKTEKKKINGGAEHGAWCRSQ